MRPSTIDVDPTSLARFADACGAVRPLDLAIRRADGSLAGHASLTQPFAVIGRDPYCDIAISDPDLSPRHAAVQVIGGMPYVIDVSGRSKGLTWSGVPKADGWLRVGEPVGLGAFKLHLVSPVSERSAPDPLIASPLVPHAAALATYPNVTIEFRNGRTNQNHWNVNRVLTFIGRAKACKINLTSDDVSLFHCYLLLTADGLWVVDTFGRGGVSVNGKPVRFCRLHRGDEISVARFQLGCQYPLGDPKDVVSLTTASPLPKWPGVHTPLLSVPPVENQPSFMAQRHSVSTTPPPSAVGSSSETPHPRIEMPRDLAVPEAAKASAGLESVSGPTFEQFQQSMLLMMKMFGQMQQQQMAGIQQEMARLSTLTEELQKLQMQIAQSVRPGPAPAALPHHNPLPSPDEVAGVTDETAQQHNFVFERMAAVEEERQSIWKRLSGLMGMKPSPAS